MKRIFIYVIVLGLFLNSCEENPSVQEDAKAPSIATKATQKGYQVIDGILHFASATDASQLADSLDNMSEDEFFAWEEANHFYSLYHAIYDAEEDIFSDSLSFNSKLAKYKDLVFLDEEDMLQAKVPARFYQLICNKEGYFYIGEYMHQVDQNKITAGDGKTRSIDSRDYIVSTPLQTRVESDPRFPLASATYTGNKRRVHIDVLYIRRMVRESNGEWKGQQILQLESTSRKKFLGGYKKYKTLHKVDALGFYCENGAYQNTDGSYGTRVVRFEGLGGGGSVGEEKTMTIQYPLSPSTLWIPEKYIPVKEDDIRFVQTKVTTRGTGRSGAIINYIKSFPQLLPFSFPTAESITIARPLVTQNF